MNHLKEIWNELTLRYTTDGVLVDQLWTELEKNYTASGRHYHNLSHLKYMMDRAVDCKNNLTDPDTVLFSIFYHDIVYKPNRQDNEQRSAEVALNRLTDLGVPANQINKCRKQILATKTHLGYGDNDTIYLLDFDLSILGENPEGYKDYTRKIRLEYSMYSDLIYIKGRKKVLQHFLGMDRIFKTDEFYGKYEQKARENIKAELAEMLGDIGQI